jgi:hypothetical protein
VYYEPFFFHGQFSAVGKTSLLAIDGYDRVPKVFTAGQTQFVQHSFYAY